MAATAPAPVDVEGGLCVVFVTSDNLAGYKILASPSLPPKPYSECHSALNVTVEASLNFALYICDLG